MTDYRGLTTAEINDLRHRLRDAGVEYHVVKHSLAQLAARNAGLEQVAAAIKTHGDGLRLRRGAGGRQGYHRVVPVRPSPT